jgi:hypothetical protein
MGYVLQNVESVFWIDERVSEIARQKMLQNTCKQLGGTTKLIRRMCDGRGHTSGQWLIVDHRSRAVVHCRR